MGLIDSVAVPIVVKRWSLPGGQVDGRWANDPDGYEELDVQAAVQPQDPRTLVNARDGQRTKSSLSLYTETQLKPADDKVGTPADIVVYGGLEYEVRAVSYFSGFGLAAYNVIAIEMDADPEVVDGAPNPYAEG